MCVCTCQQSDAILLQQCASLFVRARVCVCFSDRSPHEEGGTPSTAAPLCSELDNELLFFSSFHLSTSLALLHIAHQCFNFQCVVFIILISSLPSSPLQMALFVCCWFSLFFSLPLSSSLSLTLDSLSISPFMPPGPLSFFFFKSISHHLSVTISVSSITPSCSSHSSSNFSFVSSPGLFLFLSLSVCHSP